MGVDPGTRNLGVCLIDQDTGAIVFSVNLDLVSTSDSDSTACVRLVAALVPFFQFAAPGFVVVELQSQNYRMKLVETVVLTIAALFLIPAMAVSACTIKEHFHTEGTGFNGHYQNKKDAVTVVEKLTGETVTNHQADAYLLARWYADISKKV